MNFSNPNEKMHQFLEEMVELTGQIDNTRSTPVLELQFGDIQTITSMSENGKTPCLSITALLPRSNETPKVMQGTNQCSAPEILAKNRDMLWDADEGRYVMVRKIPIADLPDGRSVLDTILDTFDQATDWFASLTSYRQ